MDDTPNPGTSPDLTPEQPAQPDASPAPETTPETTQTEQPPLHTVNDYLKELTAVRTGETSAGDQPAPESLDPAAIVKPPSRKFDGLQEDEIPFFKRMPNELYNRLYPEIVEARGLKPKFEQTQKDLEEARKAQFFTNDRAWELTPEYQELTEDGNRFNQEVLYWQQQLTLLENGEPAAGLVFDPQSNQYYKGSELPVSANSRSFVISALSKAQMLQSQNQAEQTRYAQTFKSQFGNYQNNLQSVRSKVFAGADLNALAKAAQRKLELFPQYVRGRQEMQLLAEALVMIDGLTALLNQSKAKAGSSAIKARTAVSSGPTTEKVQPNPSGPPGTKVKDYLDELQKVRMGLAS